MAQETVETRVKIYQATIFEKLRAAVLNDKVGQAYLFSGPEGSGKEAMALEFARLMNCTDHEKKDCGPCRSCTRFRSLQHEHLYFVVPMPANSKKKQVDSDDVGVDSEDLNVEIQKKADDPFHKIRIPKASRILIDSIRSLRKQLYLKSLEQGRKVVLIFDAHLLTAGQGEAANALLKILEEPPSKTTLILVTDHKSKLFQTIVSRCQQVNFPPLARSDIENYLSSLPEKDVDQGLVSGLCQGNIQQARMLAEMNRDDLHKLLTGLIRTFEEESVSAIKHFIQSLGKAGFSDKDQFRFSLTLLQLWFKNAYSFRIHYHDDLYEAGFAQSLEVFNRKFPYADYGKINRELEYAVSAPERNQHLPLVLINTVIRITKALNNEYSE